MDRPVKSPAPSALSLQDAKAHFSEVVAAAIRGRPQHVTRRGKPAVVIVGADEFERMSHAAGSKAPTFLEHLMAIPKGKKGEKLFEPRPKLKPRDVEF